MAIMQNGQKITNLMVNGREVESGMVNNRFVFPDGDNVYGNDLVIEVTVDQYASNRYFYFNLLGFDTIKVDWGDGNKETYQNSVPDGYYESFYHTYSYCSTQKKYIIRVSGGSDKLWIWHDNLTSILSFGIFGIKYLNFHDNINLTSVKDKLRKEHCNITDLEQLFSGCIKLESIEDGFFDNCTELVSVKRAFYSCASLKKINNNMFLYNEKLLNAEYCFYGCNSLIDIPSDVFGENSNVNSLLCCFSNCHGLLNLGEKFFENLKKVENFNYCFQYSFSDDAIIDNFNVTLYKWSNNFFKVFDNTGINRILNLNIKVVNWCHQYVNASDRYHIDLFTYSKIKYVNCINICCDDINYRPILSVKLFEHCDNLISIGNIYASNYDYVGFYLMYCNNLLTIGDVQFFDTVMDSFAVSFCDKLYKIGNIVSHSGDSGVYIGHLPQLTDLGIITADLRSIHHFNISPFQSGFTSLPKLQKIIIDGDFAMINPVFSGDLDNYNIKKECYSKGLSCPSFNGSNINTNVVFYYEYVFWLVRDSSLSVISPNDVSNIIIQPSPIDNPYEFQYCNYTSEELKNKFKEKGWKMFWYSTF